MAKAKHTEAEVTEALDHLRKSCPQGATIYAIVRHVSRGGMSRDLSFYAIVDGRPQWLDGWLSVALGYRRVYGARDSLRIGGCGFDAAHHVISHLAKKLHDSSDALRREWL